MPLTGTGSGVYNSDLAFKDNLVIAGTYEGFRILDFTDKTNPTEVVNYTGCNVGQGDVIVYGNLVIRSWDSPASATSTCAGQLVGAGLRGHPRLRHLQPGRAEVRPRAPLRRGQPGPRGLRLAHRDRRAGPGA